MAVIANNSTFILVHEGKMINIITQKTFFPWILLLVSVFLLNYQIGYAKTSVPILVIEEDTHYDELVWQGQIATHAYLIKNTGNAELRIVSVAPD